MNKLLTCILIFYGLALNGQFESIKLLESGYLQSNRYFEDVTGDGIVDYIISAKNSCTDVRFFQIFEGQLDSENEHFFKQIYYSEFETGRFYFIDANGNGVKEIFLFNYPNSNHILVKYQDGEFEEIDVEIEGLEGDQVVDVNNDGKEEFIYESSDTFFIVNFDENFVPSRSVFNAFNDSVWDKLIYDFNNDGLKDLYDTEFHEFFIYLTGEPNEERIVIDLGEIRLTEDEVVIYDIDNNSDPDLLFRPRGAGDELEGVFLAKNIRENGFANVIQIGMAYSLEDVGIVNYVDVDFDNYPEMIVETRSGTEVNFIELNSLKQYNIEFEGNKDEIYHYETKDSEQYAIINEGGASWDRNQFYFAKIEIDENNSISILTKEYVTPYYEGVNEAKISNDLNNEIIFSFDNVGAYNSIRSFVNEDFSNVTVPLVDINKSIVNARFEDFNNDGFQDIFLPKDCEILFNDGNNNYTNSLKLLEGTYSFTHFDFGDLDGNGFEDIVLYFDSMVQILFNSNGTNFNKVSYPDLNLDFFGGSLNVVHLDSDEHLDILVDGFGTLLRLFNNGDGSFLQEKLFASLDFEYDYDKDGASDLFRYYNINGDGFFLVGESGGFGEDLIDPEASFIVLGPYKDFDDFFIYDLDGDGDEDILTREDSDDLIEWFEVDGDSIMYRGNINPLFQGIDGVDLFTMAKVEGTINDLMFGNCGNLYYVNGIRGENKTISIFADLNNDNIKDDNEYLLSQYQFSVIGDSNTQEFSTNIEGSTNVILNEDSYFVEAFDNCFEINNLPIDLNSVGDTLYIGANLISNESAISYEMISPISRCDRWTNHYISISNDQCDGTLLSDFIVIIDDKIDASTIASPWAYTIDGQEVTFDISDLEIGQSIIIDFVVRMPNFEFVGQVFNHDLKVLDSDGMVLSEGVYEDILRCAYDPNDKSFTPDRSDTLGDLYVTDEKINYLIRFQNIGNDTAFTVVVRDTISPFLELSTFENVRASHDYTFEIDSSSREIVFKFENIMLVDSMTNEIESHGFIKFDIEPISHVPDFTQILNQASIYFDFNPPIHTNITQGIYLEDFSILNTSSTVDQFDNISLYPNPAQNYLNIKIGDRSQQILIFDIWGRELFDEMINNSVEINVKDWSSGVYLIKIGEVIKKLVISGK